MFSFEIINLPKSFILKSKILEHIVNEVQKIEQKKHSWTLNIVFVPDKKIQELNKNYRKVDKATDVLSFHYFDDFSQLDKKEIAWEIILSEEKIISQWKNYKLGSELECYKLIIHSIFHILWYDHEDNNDYVIMDKKENTIWKKLFN